MSKLPFTSPVDDNVPTVDDRVAVGEDLDFQRKWWKFERVLWIFFLLILIADMLGAFGRGWLAKAERKAPDGSLRVEYERIERAGTASVMTLHFGPAAIHNGRVQVFVSESIVKPLGAQRIAPQPESSVIGGAGITYTFSATTPPASAQISMSPTLPGRKHFTVQIVGGQSLDGDITILP